MNRRLGLLAVPFVCAALGGACSKNAGTTAAPPDGGDDVGDDATPDVYLPPPQEASTMHCTVDGLDPVALCLQKTVLQNELTDAYAKGKGIPPTWDAKGMPSGTHSWRDDVGFAASIGSYHCSSAVYGDNQLTPMLDAIMPDLGAFIVAELTAAPSGYDGEDYFRLRAAGAGLNHANDTTDAATVMQLADTFARNLRTNYAQTVTLPDHSTATVLGTPDGMGHVVYAPAQVIMAAAALVDMARINASDPSAPKWTATAIAAVDYVWSRGRDTNTGLFYQQLVTSSDPDHDALGQGMPTPDALVTDVQAEAVLGLARLQDGMNAMADPDATPDNKYWIEANTIFQSLADAGLFDGDLPLSEAGLPTPPPVGAFMEALVPSTTTKDTNKTTLGNAWILGAIRRVGVGMSSPLLGDLEPQVLAAVTQQTPASSSLFTVVVDTQTGNPVQTDYLRAASKDFQYATAFSPTGGNSGQEPGATSYRADAVAAVIEGLTQLWRGAPQTASCAY